VLEPARVFFEGRREDQLTAPYDFICKAIVHLFRGQQGDAAVVVLFVIPEEEILAKRPAVLDAAEAIRKLRAVLKGFEVGFRIGVVVADMGAAVSFCNS